MCPARSPRCPTVTNPAPFPADATHRFSPPLARTGGCCGRCGREESCRAVRSRSTACTKVRGSSPPARRGTAGPASAPDPAHSQQPVVPQHGDKRKEVRASWSRSRPGRVRERPPGPASAGRPPRNHLFAKPQKVRTVQFMRIRLEMIACSLTNTQTKLFRLGKTLEIITVFLVLRSSSPIGHIPFNSSLRK